MFKLVKHTFKSRPMISNMLTYGIMYTVAEASQQILTSRISNVKKKVDWEIIGRYGIISVGVLGPALYYWYRFLDAALPSTTRKTIIAKVIVDQAVAATGSISVFFTGMSILEGREDIFAELKAKFFSTYTMSCCFWLPAQALNFAVLPPYTRVAFVGMASFVWVNVLCLIKRQEFSEEDAKSPLTISVAESNEQ